MILNILISLVLCTIAFMFTSVIAREFTELVREVIEESRERRRTSTGDQPARPLF